MVTPFILFHFCSPAAMNWSITVWAPFLDAAPDRGIHRRFLGQSLGPAENRRQRIVQLVRDAGDRLTQRGHLLGLQELVVDVARLIVQLFPLAHISQECFDADAAVGGLRAGGELDPNWRLIDATQAQQIARDRPIRL